MAITEAGAWDALRQLRLSGRKPDLPVIVTTQRNLEHRLHGVGCMTILHEAGTRMPVELLDGLDVIFWFDTCELAGLAYQLADTKGVKLGRVQAWCKCANMLNTAAMSCASHQAAMEWLGIDDAA